MQTQLQSRCPSKSPATPQKHTKNTIESRNRQSLTFCNQPYLFVATNDVMSYNTYMYIPIWHSDNALFVVRYYLCPTPQNQWMAVPQIYLLECPTEIIFYFSLKYALIICHFNTLLSSIHQYKSEKLSSSRNFQNIRSNFTRFIWLSLLSKHQLSFLD